MYNETTKTISLDRLDTKSLRGYPTNIELTSHNERSADNKPWRKFQIAENPNNTDYTWKEIQDKSNVSGVICPVDWHIPNQREMALMHSRVTSKWPNMWSPENTFTKTLFSFGNQNRPGFAVTLNGGVFFLLHGGDTNGRVRCVKDIY